MDTMLESITLEQMYEWTAFYELQAEAQKTPAPQAPKATPPKTHWRDLKGMMGTRAKPRE